MTADLFESLGNVEPSREVIGDGALLLRGLLRLHQNELIAAVEAITAAAPFRHLITPGGHRMSVAMTNCGDVGWVSDPSGYRYDPVDPDSGRHWPAMPPLFRRLAEDAAASAGFADFAPDACLINRYEPGAKLSMHQDRDENDRTSPIVSMSLGLPAIFMFGGLKRDDRPKRYRLTHGDVVVWGGSSRFAYHGVAPLADGEHSLLGRKRINLTFRRAR